MPLSHGDKAHWAGRKNRQAGLTGSQHGQLKPPTRPGQSASCGLCDQLKNEFIYATIVFLCATGILFCAIKTFEKLQL
jgi:hypothetical protein